MIILPDRPAWASQARCHLSVQQSPVLAPQLDQLAALITAQLLDHTGVDVFLAAPPAQARLADPQISGHLGDRFVPATSSRARRWNSSDFAAGITDSFPEAIITSESVSGEAGQAPTTHRPPATNLMAGYT